MREVLAHIEKKKREFAKLPLFEYMRDTSIDPRQRLAWVPYLAPLAMGFGDLWKYVLRREPTTNEIQQMINKHTYEDENHWRWYPKDIKTLGFCEKFDFKASLEFLWSEETEKTRLLPLQIAMLTCNLEPQVLLVAIEALEATAYITFKMTATVTNELQKTTYKNYLYFGNLHLIEDSTHSLFEEDKQKIIESIRLTEKQDNDAYQVIDQIFDLFTECFHEIIENHLEHHQTVNTKTELVVS